MTLASTLKQMQSLSGDDMTYEHSQELYVNRNKSVAKSFYRQLKTEGFTHQQIIELSTTLLDLVTEDLRDQVHEPNG